MDIFVVLQANYTIIIESTQIRRTRAELEAACTSQKAIGAKNRRREEHCKDFTGCEFLQPTKFCRLRNFVTCPVCCLTTFFTAFCDIFPNCPPCNFVVSYFFVISLTLSSILASVKLCKISQSLSINKFGAKAFNFPALLIFPPFLSLSCTFSPTKHPLRMTTQGMLS